MLVKPVAKSKVTTLLVMPVAKNKVEVAASAPRVDDGSIIDGLRKRANSSVTLTPEAQALADGDNVFLQAIFNGEIAKVTTLLDAGQMINVEGENGLTTIHKAVAGIIEAQVKSNKGPTTKDDLQMLSLLVSRGAYVDYSDAYHKRPLNICFDAQEYGKAICEYLVSLVDESGARIVDMYFVREKDGARPSTLHARALHMSDGEALGGLHTNPRARPRAHTTTRWA